MIFLFLGLSFFLGILASDTVSRSIKLEEHLDMAKVWAKRNLMNPIEHLEIHGLRGNIVPDEPCQFDDSYYNLKSNSENTKRIGATFYGVEDTEWCQTTAELDEEGQFVVKCQSGKGEAKMDNIDGYEICAYMAEYNYVDVIEWRENPPAGGSIRCGDYYMPSTSLVCPVGTVLIKHEGRKARPTPPILAQYDYDERHPIYVSELKEYEEDISKWLETAWLTLEYTRSDEYFFTSDYLVYDIMIDTEPPCLDY
jgi:hypothetical protein